MMRFVMYMLIPILMFFSLLSCGSNSDASGIKRNISTEITVLEAPFVERLGIAEQIHAKISLGEKPKDVYMLLSNYSEQNMDVKIDKILKHSDKIISPIEENISDKLEHFQPTIVHAPRKVELFREHIKTYLNRKIKSVVKTDKNEKTKKVVQGESHRFYLDENGYSSTVATARKVVSVATVYGVKKLSVWVSDDSFGVGCPKARCVTQTMVDALANSFLKEGSDNDVYDWVSNVFGAEWGSNNHSNMISPNNEMTILLTDIDNDNSTNGGVLGYFYPKDNFKKEVMSGSNERIMLYADGVLFANGNGSWSMHDFWPKEMISTLAHEFQHMIHFYQKTTLRTADTTDTWINEMLSESTEDLIASKIQHTGSRGIDYRIGTAGNKGNILGRYPLFNAHNNISLTRWYGGVENYSVVNAFGAFLLRNYGGAKVLHDIVYNNFSDEKAIVKAVQQTPQGKGKVFNDLLREWGIAVFFSDNPYLTETLPHYNTGGYMPNQYNLSTYALGSINFFNYHPQPQFYGEMGTVQAQGNYYYKVGTGLTGDITINLRLNGKTEATLIVK